jgi:hypothetical protein
MKQVTTDTKCSSCGKPETATDAQETAAAGNSAHSEPSAILPGKLEHWNKAHTPQPGPHPLGLIRSWQLRGGPHARREAECPMPCLRTRSSAFSEFSKSLGGPGAIGANCRSRPSLSRARHCAGAGGGSMAGGGSWGRHLPESGQQERQNPAPNCRSSRQL